MSGSLPLVLLAQTMSVIGDAFGQRVARVRHSSSRRRFMMDLALTSGLQVVILLGIAQVTLPRDVLSAVYVDRKEITCYHEIDVLGKDISCSPSTCEVIECRPQGPGTFLNAIPLHPALLLNGCLGIAYYIAEAMLYHQPLALVFLVLASLFSAFLIRPFCMLFGIAGGSATPASVLALGIIGSLLCVFEVPHGILAKIKGRKQSERIEARPLLQPVGDKSERLSDDSGMGMSHVAPTAKGAGANAGRASTGARLRSGFVAVLAIVIPFLILSITYAVWFVAFKYFNDKYHQNVFGYTSLDQGMLPFYVLGLFLVSDIIKPLRGLFDTGDDVAIATEGALEKMWSEMHIAESFIYRLLINGRAVIYFYLAVWYDLNRVYLQLTLFRIVISWFGSLVLVLVFPRWIQPSEHERSTAIYLPNLLLRIAGTGLIIGSIVLLEQSA